MINLLLAILIALSYVVSTTVSSMTFDNRHFPLLDKPFVHHHDAHFFFRAQPYLMFANHSIIDDEEDIDDSGAGLFEINGKYDQRVLNDALLRSGRISESILSPTFLSDNFLGGIPWSMRGSFDAVGAAFRWYQRLGCNWEVGGSFLFMGVRSRLEMLLRLESLSRGQQNELYADNEAMRKADGVGSFFWNKFGPGDLDFYVRFGTLRHFILRSRTLDAGFKVGMYVPTGVKKDINNPASLPFGGNGHWGIYLDGSMISELKEDLFLGLELRLIKRFSKTNTIRMPLVTTFVDAKGNLLPPEPDNFGVIVGKARIDPGVTFVFAPYVAFAGLREGFGGQIGYTLIAHGEDDFRNLTSGNNFEIAVGRLRERSEWNAEYVSCSLFYDSGYDREVRGRAPLISLDIDIPVHFLASKRVNKTFGVSLRVEFDLW